MSPRPAALLLLAAAPVLVPFGRAAPETAREGSSPGAGDPAADLGAATAVEVEHGRSDGSPPPAFRLRYRDRLTGRRVSPAFVLPGERLRLSAAAPSERAPAPGVRASAPDGGVLRKVEDSRWEWSAPRGAGLRRIHLVGPEGRDTLSVHAFVMVPFDSLRDGSLNGYQVGDYPEERYGGMDRYRRPRGFVEVTAENRGALVSPRFRLGQFLCKQAGGWPKYVVLQERLLWKLEAAADELDRRGLDGGGLVVMSGYRTPAYNRAIGQSRYSRHMYGDAADVFVDRSPRDGRMDDLDGDGRATVADADVLHRIVDALSRRSPTNRWVGGLGKYPANAAHGPFVHVDARGYRARW